MLPPSVTPLLPPPPIVPNSEGVPIHMQSATALPPIFVAPKTFQPRKLLFLIPIILLVGTMAVVTAIIPSLRQSQTPEIIPSPVPTLIPATPVATPVKDPTLGWKAYVNRAAELSFKYPPNLSLKEEKISKGEYSISLSDSASASGSLVTIVVKQNAIADDILGETVKKDTNETEADIQVSGLTGKEGPNYIIVQKDTTGFVFLFDRSTKQLVESVVGTVRFVSIGITEDWQTYSNELGSYALRFPQDWQATSSAKTVSIRKNPTETQFQNLVIETTVAGAKQKVELTASEIISSLQNLSGWGATPSLDFRTIGGGQAEIISGEKDGAWQIYAVVWYKNNLIEISWRDTLLRPEQNTFDDMLGSFLFR